MTTGIPIILDSNGNNKEMPVGTTVDPTRLPAVAQISLNNRGVAATGTTSTVIGPLSPANSAVLQALPSATTFKPGAIIEFPGLTSGFTPMGLCVGGDGNLWTISNGLPKIARITPDGVATYFTIPSGNFGGWCCLGNDGNVWFTCVNGFSGTTGSILRITPSGTMTEFTLPTTGDQPQFICAGPDNNLWFTKISGGVTNPIAKVTTAGVFTDFAAPSAIYPQGICTGPDGRLWWVDPEVDLAFATTTAGVTTTFPITAGSAAFMIVTGAGGHLWYTQTGRQFIGKLGVDGSLSEFPTSSYSLAIVSAADGNLYFSQLSNAISRITIPGAVTDVASVSGEVYGMAAGPDGNIWFVQLTTASKYGFMRLDQSSGEKTPTGWSVTQKPNTAGGAALGTTALPWSALKLGNAATNNTTWTGPTTTAARTFSTPDADSNSVIPTTATTNQFLTNITVGGVQTKAQPSSSNLSDVASIAFLASPALTGNPTAPTQTALNNSTRLATTAYADGAVSTLSTAVASTYAPLASPALTGNPTAPTQTAGNSSTRIATTAFVSTAISAISSLQVSLNNQKLVSSGEAMVIAPISPTLTPILQAMPAAVTFTPDSIAKEFALPTSGSYVEGCCTGPDGNIWYVCGQLPKVGKITPDGVVTEYTIPSGSGSYWICLGPDNNLWFTEQTTSKIGRITPAGVITEFNTPTTNGGTSGQGICVGPDGNLWWISADWSVLKTTTAGVTTQFMLPTTAGAFVGGICTGPDGRLWWCETSGDHIGAITTAGVITEFSLTSGTSPYAICTGSGGHLWYTALGRNVIGKLGVDGTINEFTIPTSGVYSTGMCAAADGNLYFCELNGQQIGQITIPGVITEYNVIPTATPHANGICTGAQGNIWYTNAGNDKMGKLRLIQATGDKTNTGWTVNQTPSVAGGAALGTSALPWSGIRVGAAATNNTQWAPTVTAARTFSTPDADSNSVIPTTATTNQFLTNITSGGLQTKAQPSSSNLSDVASIAFLASPAFTGNPTAPTQTALNNSTRLATTAYVDSAVSALSSSVASTYLTTSSAASTYAPLASPALTGNPTAPTQTAGNNSTRIATTAYTDTADALKANIASPTLTGTPAAPTASVSTNTTQIATTAFVMAQFPNSEVSCSIDNNGSALPVQDIGYIEVPFNCTINRVTLLADVSGSVVVNIYKSTYANYPGTMTSIVASAKPTLSSAQKNQDTSLTGWTTTVSAGDILKFVIESASICTRLTVSLKVTKT